MTHASESKLNPLARPFIDLRAAQPSTHSCAVKDCNVLEFGRKILAQRAARVEQRQLQPATSIDYANEAHDPAIRLVDSDQSPETERQRSSIIQNIDENNFVQPGSESSAQRCCQQPSAAQNHHKEFSHGREKLSYSRVINGNGGVVNKNFYCVATESVPAPMSCRAIQMKLGGIKCMPNVKARTRDLDSEESEESDSNTFFEGVHDISSLFHSGDHALEYRRDQDHVFKRQKSSLPGQAGRGDRGGPEVPPVPRKEPGQARGHEQERGAQAGGVSAMEGEISGRGPTRRGNLLVPPRDPRRVTFAPSLPRSLARSREVHAWARLAMKPKVGQRDEAPEKPFPEERHQERECQPSRRAAAEQQQPEEEHSRLERKRLASQHQRDVKRQRLVEEQIQLRKLSARQE